MRPIVVALTLALLGLAGALVVTLRTEKRSPRDARAATPPAEEPAGRHEIATAHDASIADDARAAISAAAPPARPVAGVEDGGAARVDQPKPDFAWKYGRQAHEQLVERLMVLEGEAQLAADKLFAARFEAGEFTTHAISRDDVRGMEVIARSLQNEGELCTTRLIASSDAVAETLKIRPSAVQVVCLSRAEHAELYALVDERDWLRARVAQGDGDDP